MKQEPLCVRVGTTFDLNGCQYTVEVLSGASVLVRSSRGEAAHYQVAALFNTPGFKITGSDQSISETSLSGVPASAVTDAKALAKHVLEAITGYQSGTSEDAAPDEPKREYDPEIFHLTQRLAHKASELRKTVRFMWIAKRAYIECGLMGLVDKRKLKQKGALIDERVRLKLIEVINSFEEKTNPTKSKLAQLTRKGLRESYPDIAIPFPSESSFNRLVDLLAEGTQLFGSAKQRRSNANRPERPYSHFFADRPGELVV